MEAIILALRLILRRGWRGLLAFLERSGLSAMPPVATVAALLVIGIAIPMALGIDTTPTSLQRSLAIERLDALEVSPMPETSPAGETFCTTPAFHWVAHPKAKRYRLELRKDGELRHSTQLASRVLYLLPSPGDLDAGSYRFRIEAFDQDGEPLGKLVDQAFTVKADEQLAKLEAEAIRRLEADAAAFVMAGAYASKQSVHDVRSALTRCLALAPQGKDAERARAILGRR